ncbi:MFS transporter [Rickettsiales endosymbiont of Stachyamoeba lipophora]|uniref:MFS transporter n=1 Tax=Rickettsiales endosymbiont of Stachyamoeba lipophora TaxID=2486578 RepID=UPI000F64686F|nr:MFS transporter [Rickettsiales endosymbiont of Stachyamoeba lipophora]AZL16232.1 MFS transporter [Rickettsiales endosymbiont of Stachyamoeba lipophora]
MIIKINNKRLRNTVVLFLVTFFEIIACLETDINVPSFPNMIDYFGINPADIHWVVAINMVGICLASWVVGPLSDTIGRRKVLLFSGVFFLIGSIIAVNTTDFSILLLARFIQGIGCSSYFVICSAVIFDLYDKKQAVVITGYLGSLITIFLAIAPIVGNYININYGWRMNFILILFLAIIAFFLSLFFMEESLADEKKAKWKFKRLFQDYYSIFSNLQGMKNLNIIGISLSVFITYIVNLSVIFVDNLHVSQESYGYHQGIIMFIFALCSLFTGKIVVRLGFKIVKAASHLLTTLGSSLLIIVALNFATDANLITLSMILFTIGYSFIMNLAFVEYMSCYPQNSGAASSLNTTYRLILNAIILVVVSMNYNGTILPVAICIFIGSLVMLALNMLPNSKESVTI